MIINFSIYSLRKSCILCMTRGCQKDIQRGFILMFSHVHQKNLNASKMLVCFVAFHSFASQVGKLSWSCAGTPVLHASTCICWHICHARSQDSSTQMHPRHPTYKFGAEVAPEGRLSLNFLLAMIWNESFASQVDSIVHVVEMWDSINFQSLRLCFYYQSSKPWDGVIGAGKVFVSLIFLWVPFLPDSRALRV